MGKQQENIMKIDDAVCEHYKELFKRKSEAYKLKLYPKYTDTSAVGSFNEGAFVASTLLTIVFIIVEILYLLLSNFIDFDPDAGFVIHISLMIVVITLITCSSVFFYRYKKWENKEFKNYYNNLIKTHVDKLGLGEENGVFFSFDGATDLYHAKIINNNPEYENLNNGNGISKKDAMIDLSRNYKIDEKILSATKKKYVDETNMFENQTIILNFPIKHNGDMKFE